MGSSTGGTTTGCYPGGRARRHGHVRFGRLSRRGLEDPGEECGAQGGASAGIEVSETTWTVGGPGTGTAVIEGVTWKTWDYREDIYVSEELAAMLRQPEEGREKRQCVTKAIAAGVAWRSLARQPTLEEADSKAWSFGSIWYVRRWRLRRSWARPVTG